MRQATRSTTQRARRRERYIGGAADIGPYIRVMFAAAQAGWVQTRPELGALH